MVRKINGNEYLKRYDNMTVGERQEYEKRVGEWLATGYGLLEFLTGNADARLQNVMDVSTTWNDLECQAFEEGARLLSAVALQTDTWLPDLLYVKSAKRAILKMHDVLQEMGRKDGQKPAKPAEEKPKEEPAVNTRKETQAVGGSQVDGGKLYPVRPKHIDQYIHLLPEKTQERAAQVKDLYRDLDDAREKMRLLMDDPTAKDTDREAWAKKATSIDNRLRKILDEIDAEWNKLVEAGRVVVDDLGNARLVPDEGGEQGVEDAADDTSGQAELTSEQRARRRELRKWLVDTRRGNGDTREEHMRKWQESFSEYLTLEGDAAYEDEKIKAAAAHYGIDLASMRSTNSNS